MSAFSADPVQLAARAAALRRLATRLAECPVGGLAERAGAGTWLGPTADRCRGELSAHVRSINEAIDDLAVRAVQLDHQAANARPLHGPC